ncbi:hypothetical protein AU476_22500 [Cupriavidus sp. UYMSc13B]|nr:hypothetical protein AU476_22500 [Cupriavidus sp. UYMSc13B]
MPEYFDSLETRAPEVREQALLAALARQVAHARDNAAYFAEMLSGVDPRLVTSRAALAALPVTRKSAPHGGRGRPAGPPRYWSPAPRGAQM